MKTQQNLMERKIYSVKEYANKNSLLKEMINNRNKIVAELEFSKNVPSSDSTNNFSF